MDRAGTATSTAAGTGGLRDVTYTDAAPTSESTAATTGNGQRTPYVHPQESRHGLIKTLVDPVIAKFRAKFAV